MPLELFRNRAFTVSVASVFLASFGFFAAVVFLPRWFQVVGGASATISGYEMLPLLGGVIISAVASGQILARTGRYRLLIFGALVVLAAGLAALTQLRVDTPLPILWASMFVTGLGMGPVFSVFPLVVQNSVPVRQIGAATSNLSFFQQVGGSVGLAITGTLFATSMTRELPAALASAGVPSQVSQSLAGAGGVAGAHRRGQRGCGAARVAAGRRARARGAVPARDRRAPSTRRSRSRPPARSRSGSRPRSSRRAWCCCSARHRRRRTRPDWPRRAATMTTWRLAAA